MNLNRQLSFYIKTSQILVGIISFFFIMYVGQSIVLPLIFATIIAILLNPMVNFLHRRRMNRVVAILITVTVALIVVVSFVIFISYQLRLFGDNLPQLRVKFSLVLRDLVHWVASTFHMSTAWVNEWISNTTHNGMERSSEYIGYTLGKLKNVFVNVILIPVYVFMILFYKSLLLKFISQVFANRTHGTVVDVLQESKALIQSYLVGLLKEAGIMAVLNSVSLLLIGIDYAILLGITCALLNVIPYIGGIIAVILTMIFAFMTKSSLAAFLVLIAHLAIQFIDNNYLVPKIVGAKVKINALASIVVVLIGGELFGIPGMFLSIPLTAIIKVICDRIKPLQPLGFLLGDNLPPIGKSFFVFAETKEKPEAE